MSPSVDAKEMKIMKPCDTCQYPEKCELFGKCQQPPAKEKPLSPSDAASCCGSSGVEAGVCEDIAKRQRVGLNKYGVSVADNPLDLRQWLNHAYEECLDQAVYLKRAMAELDRHNR